MLRLSSEQDSHAEPLPGHEAVPLHKCGYSALLAPLPIRSWTLSMKKLISLGIVSSAKYTAQDL